MIKHKYFTCHCNSEKCRYNKSSIYGFLKEYYQRIGEPLPDDAKPPTITASQTAKATKSEDVSMEEKTSEDIQVKDEAANAEAPIKQETPEQSTEDKPEQNTETAEKKAEPLEANVSEAEVRKSEEKEETPEPGKSRRTGRPRRSKT